MDALHMSCHVRSFGGNAAGNQELQFLKGQGSIVSLLDAIHQMDLNPELHADRQHEVGCK
jgi:hypothetical protein